MLLNTLPRLDILVPQVALDPNARSRAAELAGTRASEVVKALAGQHEPRTTARVSDAGRCSLELYSFFKGWHNLPDDGVNQIAKMDNGTMFGWWLAALEAIAIGDALAENGVPVTFQFEEEVFFNGVVPGHVDLGVHLDGKPWWLIENKSTYSSFPVDPPHLHAPQQPLQAATYSLEGGYPQFSIVTIAPAVQSKWDKELKARIEFPKLVQHDYETADWADRARAEMARLVDIANADEAPAPDLNAVWRERKKDGKIVEAWRCRYCRFGRCPENENPLRLLIADE